MKKKSILKGKKGKRIPLLLLILSLIIPFPRQAIAQDEQLKLSLKQASLKEIINEIKRISSFDFVYSDADLEAVKRRDVAYNGETINSILSDCLRGTGLSYHLNNQTIIIRKGAPQQAEQKRSIRGTVTDEQGLSLPGVSVVIKGTSMGVATDIKGGYTLNIPEEGECILVFSFIGMKTQEIAVGKQETINVRMIEEAGTLEDVVVTGYFERSKNTFTGSVSSIKREELRKFGNVSLISALQMVDPSFKIKENNERGSDPNTLPDFFVRGESSFMGNSSIPTFIVDGYEVSLQYVFDMDMDRIESLTILKDASATIHYGSRAANGVVVIETRRPAAGKFSVSYSNRTGFSAADLSEYDLMDAREKLDYEIKAGLFTNESPSIQHAMNQSLEEYKSSVFRGVDTDWLAQPIRDAFSHSHSIYLEGGADAVVYGINASYSRNGGVIKESYRENYGLNFDFTYRVKSKASIRNSFSYGEVNIQNSPYGSFSNYAKANPYNPIHDDKGKLIKNYAVHYSRTAEETQYGNPLYNATLPFKDSEKIITIGNNLSLDYFITPELRFKSALSITKSTRSADKYTSPEHTSFTTITDPIQKGSYTITNGKDFSYNLNSTLTYSLRAEKHLLYSGIGLNLIQNERNSNSYTATGFLDERFNEIGFAMSYLAGGRPSGSEGKDRMVGFLGNINYSYDDRYFIDLSGRVDGSSKYGKEKRFAPLWSAGAGWNINNEAFIPKGGIVNRLTLRASIGATGNQQFEPYIAKTMLQYSSSYVYYQAMGAVFMGYGNEQLEWQKSIKRNIGIDIEILERRLTARFDYYSDRTNSLLLPVSVAPSLGFTSYTENFGEQSNKGYEFDLNAVLIRRPAFDWAINVSGTHNQNRVEKISNALASLNETNNSAVENQTRPIAMYEEGESITAIKVVRSLGINPASGKELFLTRDGKITELWDYRDKIIAGDTEPTLEGNIGTNVIWKQFSLNLLLRYSFGGQVYNTTLANRIEGASPYTNADRRVLAERWQKPGDHSFYKDIADRSVSNATSRFVQDNNFLEMSNISLSYRVDPEVLRPWGISNLRLGLNSNNLFYFSTVKRERGLDYPFARQFTFSLNLNF